MIATNIELIPRFFSHVVEEDRGYLTPCWVWHGARDSGHKRRYGRFRIMSKNVLGTEAGTRMLAHIFSFLMFVGPIELGNEIDHECEIPPCVRPTHLKQISAELNNAYRNKKEVRA